MGTIKLDGRYASAVIFTADNHTIENYALLQIQMLCDNAASLGSRMRIMPDVHPAKVGTIGLTMTVGDKIMPNLTGIDIGCGITLAHVKGKIKEFQKLDTVIREKIPSGFSVRSRPHHDMNDFDFESLFCQKHIYKQKALLSAGTLGSGNHFIELNQDDDKNTYLAVHSGSRHLGKEVTEFYLREGQKQLREQGICIPYELTYLEGALKDRYLHDLAIVQQYAEQNRRIIIAEICKGMKWKILDVCSCIHNYVDTSPKIIEQFGSPMLRKGAVSAQKGESVIIPVNMRDGILLGKGLGNMEWNASAPHGSGRILKREDVKNHYTLSSFKSAMKGVYSSCIRRETLDEAPFAYRGTEEIQKAVSDTVHIEKIIRPIYNFKGDPLC